MILEMHMVQHDSWRKYIQMTITTQYFCDIPVYHKINMQAYYSVGYKSQGIPCIKQNKNHI